MLFKNYDELVLNGQTPALQQKRKDILDMLIAAVEAVDSYLVIERVVKGRQLVFESETIDLSSFDHLYVVGFGKASVGMAQAMCDVVPVTKGVVVTNDSSRKIHNSAIEVVVGGHPLPNKESIFGTEKILDLLKQCDENDCVIVLISGGGSSLLCKPLVPLVDLQKTTGLLLQSGADINEINTVRKHLSMVQGGQLAQYMKGVMISLIISDVVNDPISSIASGPTCPDPTTFIDAKEIFKRYKLWHAIPASVRTVIENGIAGAISETPKAADPVFKNVFNFIVANNDLACQTVVRKAEELGYAARLMTTSMTGEARTLGPFLVNKAIQSISRGKTVFITGGEPTVKVRGHGTGGRNQELVLSCVEVIADREMVVASFATDGIDGNSDVAGALADGGTLARARKENLDVSGCLEENNSFVFFSQLGDVLRTGSTGTNVMDIQIVLR
jgi:glycerate-2-kinase